MEVLFIMRSDEMVERYDYRDAVEIQVDGKSVFSVSDGEPEDSNLMRDFGDVYKIPDLMKMAYEAGKKSEAFNVVYEERDEV